jgi:hypothetical protein
LNNKSSVHTKILKARPANAYGIIDSTPYGVLDISKADRDQLMKYLHISAKVADSIINFRKKTKIERVSDLRAIKGLSDRTFHQIMKRIVLPGDKSLHILNVSVEQDFVYSDQPFKLKIEFFNGSEKSVVIASARVIWDGEPFEVEQEIEESMEGIASIEFDANQTLPVGHAEFWVSLYRAMLLRQISVSPSMYCLLIRFPFLYRLPERRSLGLGVLADFIKDRLTVF